MPNIASRMTLENFIAWVRQQDPSRQFDFTDIRNCALAQFGRAMGIADCSAGGGYVRDRKAAVTYAICSVEQASIICKSETFGEIAARYDAMQAELVACSASISRVSPRTRPVS